MAAFIIVVISVLVITELQFVYAVPVPKLPSQLLCELLCEHCNGVPTMESGHCNCEVPGAHFKDNYACLERVQISAAEVNLKFTHFKSTRSKRSVTDLLGRIKSKALEESQINYSKGFNTISEKPFTPLTPDPTYVDKSEYQIPEHRELLAKRYAEMVPAPELGHAEGDKEQSTERELFGNPSINYFQDSSSMEALYSKNSITPMPSSVLSGSKLRTEKLTVLRPQRRKRSNNKLVEVSNKEDGTISYRKIANSNGNYAVRVNVQADIEIPGLQFNQVSKERSMNSKSQENDEVQSQDSPSLLPDKSSILKSGTSNLKQNTVAQMADNTQLFVSNEPTDVSSNPVSNKFRSGAEENLENTVARVPSKLQDLLDESNSLISDTKKELPCPTMFKLPTLPTLISPSKFRATNEQQILQRANKLNDLKSRIEKFLSREQSKLPFQNLLQKNELLKGPASSKVMAENTPFAKLALLNSLPKCSPLRLSQNRELEELVKLKDQLEGMTLLEKIKNNQVKLKQNLLKGKYEFLGKSRAQSGCQFENGLPLKLNPSMPVESKDRKSNVGCDDYENDVNAIPTPSPDKYQLKSQKTESVGKNLRLDSPVTDTPTDDAFVSTILPNEPTKQTELINTVNENEETTTVSQSESEAPKHHNGFDISSTQLEVTGRSLPVSTTDSVAARTNHLPLDSNASQQPLETTSETLLTTSPAAASVSSTVPISGLEPHSIQSKDTTLSSNDKNADAASTHGISNHPHFANHHENPNYFPPAFMSLALGNNIQLTPEETYRAMFDPNSFRNDMQRINYPPLFVRNDFLNTKPDAVLNRPMVYVPNPVIPFDHLGRLMPNFNGAPDHLNHPVPNEQSGMLMRAFVPAESFPNNPENGPTSNVFVLKPLLSPNGNIPYSEIYNQIRNGNAIIEILPINIEDAGSSGP